MSREDLAEAAKSYVEKYEPNPEVRRVMAGVSLTTVSGPSGVGKDTLIRKVLAKNPDQLHCPLSTTSREPEIRDEVLEEDGRHYKFMHQHRAWLLGDIVAGDLVQIAFGPHSHLYGSYPEAYVDQVPNIGDFVTGEVMKIEKSKIFNGSLTKTYVVPDTFELWMRWLNGRGSIPPEKLKSRFIEAEKSLLLALEPDLKDRFIFIMNKPDNDDAVKYLELAATGAADLIPKKDEMNAREEAAVILHRLRSELGASSVQ